MVDVLLTIFWGIVLLSIIVVLHEGGHFLAAKACKVRVPEFMVGLPGPSIGFKRKKGQTRFGITAVPLGGYTRIAGMDEWHDETNLPRAAAYIYKCGKLRTSDLERCSRDLGFDLEENLEMLYEWGTVERRKFKPGADGTGAGTRGSYGDGDQYDDTNMFAYDADLYQDDAYSSESSNENKAPRRTEYEYLAPQIGDYESGEPRTIDDPEAFIKNERSQTYISLPWWKRMIILFSGPAANLLTAIVVVTLILSLMGATQLTSTISQVSDGLPAAAAGMQAGDTITAVNGQQVNSWQDFSTVVSSLSVGDTVSVTYSRDGVENTVNITAVASPDDGRPVIGVVAGTEYVTYNVWDAFCQSIGYIGEVTLSIFALINPATAMSTISQSTSIVGVSVIAKQAADVGFASFMWLMAILSISIGLMNLLPLMPLDGGRMIVETIQRVSRRLLSPRFVNGYSTLGIALVMLLFVVVTGQDIGNIATGGFPW